jgi:hypothetical protein
MATTMTHSGHPGEEIFAPAISGADTRFHLPLPVAAVLGWIAAALTVYFAELVARHDFSATSRSLLALVKISVILAAGALYARSVGGAPTDLVLSTGLAWLLFSIAADVITGIRSVGSAYQLLGDPAVPLRLGDLTMLTWLASPALFTRRGRSRMSGEESPEAP